MSESTETAWKEDKKGLVKKFTFKDFKSALEFVNKVAHLAEKAQHHPDISFGWGYVHIALFTHSQKAITDKDIELSKLIDGLVA